MDEELDKKAKPLSAEKPVDQEYVVVPKEQEEQGGSAEMSKMPTDEKLPVEEIEGETVEDEVNEEEEEEKPDPWWQGAIGIALLLLFSFSYLYGLVWGTIQFFKLWDDAKQRIDLYTNEMDIYNRMDYFSLPGIPGIHEVGMWPYYIPDLKTPNWKRLLNLTYIAPVDATGDTFENSVASLENLFFAKGTRQDALHWVYITGFPYTGEHGDPWDKAFNELLQHRYAVPVARNATLHNMQCSGAQFMCFEWHVQEPGLMLFAPAELTWNTSIKSLAPEPSDRWWEPSKEKEQEPEPMTPPSPGQVSVFYVDLPYPPNNQGNWSIFGTTHRFPSHFEQLRLLTSLDAPWEFMLPYDPEMLAEKRMGEYFESLAKGPWPRPLLGYAQSFQDFLEAWSFGIWSPELPQVLGVTVASVILGIDFVIWESAKGIGSIIWHRFLASRPAATIVAQPEPGRLWDEFFGNAIKGVFSLAKEEKEKLERATAGSDGLVTSMPSEYLARATDAWQSAIKDDLSKRTKTSFSLTMPDGHVTHIEW